MIDKDARTFTMSIDLDATPDEVWRALVVRQPAARDDEPGGAEEPFPECFARHRRELAHRGVHPVLAG